MFTSKLVLKIVIFINFIIGNNEKTKREKNS